MSEEPQEFNEGHILEGLDRCNTILIMLHELLHEHPAVVKAGVEQLIETAGESMAEAYQIIWRLDDE